MVGMEGRAQGGGNCDRLSAGIWRGTGSGWCAGLSSRSATTSQCCEYLGGPAVGPACWRSLRPSVGVGRASTRLAPPFLLLWAREGAAIPCLAVSATFVHSSSSAVSFVNLAGAWSGAQSLFQALSAGGWLSLGWRLGGLIPVPCHPPEGAAQIEWGSSWCDR